MVQGERRHAEPPGGNDHPQLELHIVTYRYISLHIVTMALNIVTYRYDGVTYRYIRRPPTAALARAPPGIA